MPRDEGRRPTDPAGTGVDGRYRDGTYLRQNPTWHVEDSPWKVAQVLGILRDHGLTPATIAEVGCGAGAILEELGRRLPSARLVGYDLSEDAAAFWPTRRSMRVDFRLADFTRDDGHYDALLCLDVFEHVEDYYAFLRAIRGRADHTVFHIPLDISVLNIAMGGIMERGRAWGTCTTSRSSPRSPRWSTAATTSSTGGTPRC